METWHAKGKRKEMAGNKQAGKSGNPRREESKGTPRQRKAEGGKEREACKTDQASKLQLRAPATVLVLV
jgi:hypothetical protein